MAEHRGPADEFVAVKDGHQHEKVVDMGNGSPAQIGIVEQNDIAGIERLVKALHHLPDIGAELPDDHPAVGVADHGEFVVLLTDNR